MGRGFDFTGREKGSEFEGNYKRAGPRTDDGKGALLGECHQGRRSEFGRIGLSCNSTSSTTTRSNLAVQQFLQGTLP